MLAFLRNRAGAPPIWTLAALILAVAGFLTVEPSEQKHTTLEESLGPVVETRSLRL